MHLPTKLARLAVPLVLIAVALAGAGWKWDVANLL
jgi:hypothetical protein